MPEFGDAFTQQLGEKGISVDASTVADQTTTYHAVNELHEFYHGLDDTNKQVLDTLAQDYSISAALTGAEVISADNPVVAAADGKGLGQAVDDLWASYQAASDNQTA
ncbi:hypothetical protein F0L68_23465 [Solihabitans fulvus]|uniref:Uncharacterized protein n=1 Tax=Solihabitans fulvus TaxID=1892852 RepID=A0A5B2X610_9PSEU|nr:hypothetical protein [Solihabitans fulvus]KAA2258787.1 hypothetical protein F0L68_23465 [Solihabitans fulvus]